MKRPSNGIVSLVISLLIVGAIVTVGAIQSSERTDSTYTPSASLNDEAVNDTSENNDVTKENNDGASLGSDAVAQDDVALLNYLIEEEKLAHDVYVTLYEKWGSKPFSNISRSETRHQDEVLNVLQDRGISDPRTGIVGTFQNQDLQKLYDSLIAQGNQSEFEAFKVGMLIEETDIADIENILEKVKDADIVAVLNKLKSGSENHLKAFTRQLDRTN